MLLLLGFPFTICCKCNSCRSYVASATCAAECCGDSPILLVQSEVQQVIAPVEPLIAPVEPLITPVEPLIAPVVPLIAPILASSQDPKEGSLLRWLGVALVTVVSVPAGIVCTLKRSSLLFVVCFADNLGRPDG